MSAGISPSSPLANSPREFPSSLPRHVPRRIRETALPSPLSYNIGSDTSRIGFAFPSYRDSLTFSQRNRIFENVFDRNLHLRRKHQNYQLVFQKILKHPFFSISSLVFLAALITFRYDFIPFFKERKTTIPEFVQLLPRIQSLEEKVERTTKALQVQLDIIDLKNSEIVETQASLLKNQDILNDALANEVKGLKQQVGQLDSSFEKMLYKNGQIIEKHMLDMIEDILKQRARENSGKLLGLEDVRIAAKRIVEEELAKYAADVIGRPDFALEVAGGHMIAHSEPFIPKLYKDNAPIFKTLFQASLIGKNSIHPKASNVLRPHSGVPGNCLPLRGNNGTMDVSLRTAIFPDSITIDHVDKRIAFDSSSAPKDFQVLGAFLNSKTIKLIRKSGAGAPELDFLGEFHFDVDGSPVQTFQLDKSFTQKPVNYIRLKLLSNHGNSHFTCIYRLRVHGHDLSHNLPSSI